MREDGVIRKNLGDDETAAAPYIGIARTQLGILKNLMSFNNLQQLSRTVELSDGTVIFVQSVFGQDAIHIQVPAVPVQNQERQIQDVPEDQVAQPDVPQLSALNITSPNTWVAASIVSTSTTPVTYDPAIGGMYSVEYPGTVTTYNNDGTTNTSTDPSPLPPASQKVAKPVIGGVISTDKTTWLNLATGVPAAFLPTADAPCNFSVGGGTDGVRFTANASGIQFSKADQHNNTDAPDYAYPSDSGAVNSYDVLIQAQNDSARAVQAVTVGVRYFYNVSSPNPISISIYALYYPANGWGVSWGPSRILFGTANSVADAYTMMDSMNAAYNNDPRTYPSGDSVASTWEIESGGSSYLQSGHTPTTVQGNTSWAIGATSLFQPAIFTPIPDAASGTKYTNDGTTESFTLITTQPIWPLRQ